MAVTVAGALTKLAKANERLAKAEAAADARRAERDQALREAAEVGATYVVIHDRTGLSRATIAKALRRE